MSNLLEKASIITTPTAYDDGKLLSVKGGTVADFDFSRGSSATRVNSQGLIEDVQIIGGELVQNGDFTQEGSELVTNGDFSTDSDWFKGGSATISGGYLNLTASGDFAQQSITNPSQYVVRINVSYVTTSGDLRIRSNNFAETFTFSVTSAQVYTFYSPISADGLVIQSNGFIGSIDNVSVKEVGQNWQKLGADAVMSFTSDTLVLTSTGSGQGAFQNLTTITGRKYRFEAKSDSHVTDALIRVTNGSNPSSGFGDAYVVNGVAVLEFVALGTTTNLYLRNSVAGTSIWKSVSVKEITDDTDIPRIDYTDGVGSILLEPSSTNIVEYSEDFSDSYWNKNFDLTITSTNRLSPTGELNAFQYENSGSFNQSLSKTFTLSANTNYTFSLYIKRINNNTFSSNDKLRIAGYGGGLSQVAQTYLGDALNSTAIGEWVRYEVSATTNSTGGNVTFQLRSDEACAFDIFGAQLEEQSFATSYIPTSGSSVTRLGETLTNSGNADLFNDSEGVLYFETAALTDEGVDARKISINDGTNDNQITVYYHPSATNQVVPRVFVGGLSFWAGDININTVYGRTSSQFNKFAIRYSSNGIQFFFNGVLARTTTAVPSFTNTLNNLSFDNGEGSNEFYGKTKCVAVFKEALSNDELECLTGEGYESFSALAQAFNYTII